MKTVLITGGARRLGKALVEHYHAQGWNVLFTVKSSLREGTELVRQLRDRVHLVQSAVSSQSDAAAIAEWTKRKTEGDGLDLLICNASSFLPADVHSTTPTIFSRMLESNLLGPFYLAQQCHAMLQKKQGAIVNISDAQAVAGHPDFVAYAAAKSALISVTKSLALSFAPHVTVNAVLPGTLPWPEQDIYPLSAQQEILNAIPAKRIGEWADVVGAVEYLGSAKFVNGVCLPVDGARSAVF